MFVVDSQDRERIDEARQELHRILSDREMKECLLLVFANKQDLPGGSYASPSLGRCKLKQHLTAMPPSEVTEKLGLHRMRDRSWYVHPRYVACLFDPCTRLTLLSCATTGEGLFEGLQWLSQNVKKRQS